MLKIADYLSEGTSRTLLMPLCCCGTASRLNPEGGIYDTRAAEVLRQKNKLRAPNTIVTYGQTHPLPSLPTWFAALLTMAGASKSADLKPVV